MADPYYPDGKTTQAEKARIEILGRRWDEFVELQSRDASQAEYSKLATRYQQKGLKYLPPWLKEKIGATYTIVKRGNVTKQQILDIIREAVEISPQDLERKLGMKTHKLSAKTRAMRESGMIILNEHKRYEVGIMVPTNAHE